MKPIRYREFKVTLLLNRDGSVKSIETKTPTKREFVSIHEHEAEINNSYVKSTKLWYERAEEEEDIDTELEAAKKEADTLGIKYNAKISKENLLKKIETYKTN